MGDRSSSNNKPPGHILGRGFQLAKLTAKLGARAAGHSLEKLLKSGNSPENLKKYLSLQVASLAKDLGQLKGSVMKAGQLLSTYGEHFLPPEVNDILKSLQHQAPPVEWSEIRKVLEKELGPQRLGLLEIDPKPFAAASLGQVHKARVLASGENLALKVQYPGVDRAVETDLTFLKMIFQLTDLFPSGFRSQSVMEEIKKNAHAGIGLSTGGASNKVVLRKSQEFRPN